MVCTSRHEFRCKFTEELDDYLLPNWKKHLYLSGGSYLYLEDTQSEFQLKTEDDNLFYVLFRYPGATRGVVGIDRDTGVVKQFKFNDTAYVEPGIACYMHTVEQVRTRWLGQPMPELLEKIKSLPVR